MDVKAAVKRRLPEGTTERSVLFGVGRGIRLGLDLRGGDLQMFLGLYEVELTRSLRALAYRGARSFDLGGSIGYDALVLAKLTRAPVVTLECDAALAAVLAANVARNPTLGPVTVEAAAAGAATGPGTITVDDLAHRHFVPDLLKIDIEGAEVDALRGASEVLSTRRPGILLEVHGTGLERDCAELLRDAGYDPPVVVDPRRWLPEHRPLPHNRWLVVQGSPRGVDATRGGARGPGGS